VPTLQRPLLHPVPAKRPAEPAGLRARPCAQERCRQHGRTRSGSRTAGIADADPRQRPTWQDTMRWLAALDPGPLRHQHQPSPSRIRSRRADALTNHKPAIPPSGPPPDMPTWTPRSSLRSRRAAGDATRRPPRTTIVRPGAGAAPCFRVAVPARPPARPRDGVLTGRRASVGAAGCLLRERAG
jgi:hypothetical protein